MTSNLESLASSIATLPLADAHAAFGPIAGEVRRVARHVKRIVRHGGRNTSIEDVVQDVLLQVWESLRRGAFDGTIRIDRWMYVIARRTAIDHYRRSVVRARIGGSEELLEAAERNADATQDVETRDVREAIADRLDARGRSVFALLCSAMSISDICRLTGLSQPTIWHVQQRINDVSRAVCAA